MKIKSMTIHNTPDVLSIKIYMSNIQAHLGRLSEILIFLYQFINTLVILSLFINTCIVWILATRYISNFHAVQNNSKDMQHLIFKYNIKFLKLSNFLYKYFFYFTLTYLTILYLALYNINPSHYFIPHTLKYSPFSLFHTLHSKTLTYLTISYLTL